MLAPPLLKRVAGPVCVCTYVIIVYVYMCVSMCMCVFVMFLSMRVCIRAEASDFRLNVKLLAFV